MDLSSLEREIRRVPGVLACQVTAGDVVVLAAPDADADAVSEAVRAVLTVAAASPPSVRIIGGRAPLVAAPRHGRRAVAALTAGAAALAAAGVAAAVSGVFTSPERPSVGESQAAAPRAAAPDDASASGRASSSAGRRFGGRASSPAESSRRASDVQPDRQLATLAAGAPRILTFPVPLPGEAAAPPLVAPPVEVAAPAAAPAVEVAAPTPVPPPATPPTDVAPPAAVAPTTVPPATAPPATPAPAAGPPATTTPPPPAASSTTTTTTLGDQHDNDRGERLHDSNGHWETGPQGVAAGHREGERGRRG